MEWNGGEVSNIFAKISSNFPVGASEATSSSKQTDATSMKSSSRPANGVKHVTGISKTISANKENSVSSSKMDKKMTSSQEKAKSSSLTGAMALKRTLEGERGGVAMSSSETSSQSVAASNELKTAQKTQTVSRQTNLLKSSSKTKSVESSESSNSSSISKVNLVQSSHEEGGRTTMVVTLHPSQHKLCSFKEKKVIRSSFHCFPKTQHSIVRILRTTGSGRLRWSRARAKKSTVCRWDQTSHRALCDKPLLIFYFKSISDLLFCASQRR